MQSLSNVKRGIIRRLQEEAGLELVAEQIYFDSLPQNCEYPALLCSFPSKDSYTDLSGKRIGLASGTLVVILFSEDNDQIEELRESVELALGGFIRNDTVNGVRFQGFALEESQAGVWDEQSQRWDALVSFSGHWSEEVPS